MFDYRHHIDVTVVNDRPKDSVQKMTRLYALMPFRWTEHAKYALNPLNEFGGTAIYNNKVLTFSWMFGSLIFYVPSRSLVTRPRFRFCFLSSAILPSTHLSQNRAKVKNTIKNSNMDDSRLELHMSLYPEVD
jgi:hypothetical protein